MGRIDLVMTLYLMLELTPLSYVVLRTEREEHYTLNLFVLFPLTGNNDMSLDTYHALQATCSFQSSIYKARSGTVVDIYILDFLFIVYSLH